MKKSQIRTALEALGCTIKDGGRAGWIISDCPLGPWRHKEGKSADEVFGVKVEQGDPFANCFACQFHGTIGDLLVEIKYRNKTEPSGKTYDFKVCQEIVNTAMDDFELKLDNPDVEDLYITGKKKSTVFDDWWIKSFPLVADIDWAVDYLAARDVSPEMAVRLDLRADTGQQRICFPVQDFVGKYRGLHGRAIHEDTEPRYRMYTYKGINNPDVWLGEQWVNPDRPIIVVEGPFDLASVLRVYPNTVCPLFASPSIQKLKRMGHCFEWVTFYDRGTGGDTGRKRVQEYLGSDHLVKHVTPPEHRKDPGECTEDELRELLEDLL